MSRRDDPMTVESRAANLHEARAGRWLVVMSCLVMLASATQASAQTTSLYLTYGTADQGAGGRIAVLPQSTMSLSVWLSGGGAASTGNACTPSATGREICGFNFVLETNGPFVFNDFTQDPSFASTISGSEFRISSLPGRFAVNGFDFNTPPVGNRRLGTLVLSAGEVTPSDQITVRGGYIRSNLTMGQILQGTVVVPEPNFSLGLVLSSGLFLASARWGRASAR